MTKYKVIANPAAGRGTAEKAIPKVQQILKNYGLDFDIVLTERPWHAADLSREAAGEGYDVVVAMGGDGTVNEVLNGLIEARTKNNSGPTLGVLCAGGGNDFAYSVSIPRDLKSGCAVLARGRKRTIDIGKITSDTSLHSRYFGNGIGIGFDAIVDFETLKMKKLHGFISYAVAAFKVLFLYYKAPTVRMEYNGETITQPSLMISVMNGQRMGGGFKMAPEAEPDDGQFDLCIAGTASRARILGLIFHFLRGTQAGKKPIKTDRAPHIRVTAEKGVLPAHVDGEIFSMENCLLDIILLPGELEVIC